eukprot:1193242-Prorocentrum_minimum.AAC.4
MHVVRQLFLLNAGMRDGISMTFLAERLNRRNSSHMFNPFSFAFRCAPLRQSPSMRRSARTAVAVPPGESPLLGVEQYSSCCKVDFFTGFRVRVVKTSYTVNIQSRV